MNLDPETLQLILSSGENDPQAAMLKQQQARANALRQQATQAPQGRMAGRVFVPGVGEAAMNAAAGYQANKMQPQIDQGMTAMGQRNNQARSRYADAMMMAMRRQYPQQAQPVLPPDGMEDR